LLAEDAVTNSDIGSMALRPRDPKHVHGDGNDGTTTRWEKACAMSGQIDLPLANRSMRAHRQARTRLVVGIVCVAVVVALALRWAWRLYGL
jgi:hypothetical protein